MYGQGDITEVSLYSSERPAEVILDSSFGMELTLSLHLHSSFRLPNGRYGGIDFFNSSGHGACSESRRGWVGCQVQVRGLMDKAPAYGAGDCGFESHRICHFCHMLFIDGRRKERPTHPLVTEIRLYRPMTVHILLVESLLLSHVSQQLLAASFLSLKL